jgi:hypothetical protein
MRPLGDGDPSSFRLISRQPLAFSFQQNQALKAEG